jgi:hypothetical protein
MIAALYLIETAKSELQEAGLPQAETVSKASDNLTVTTRGKYPTYSAMRTGIQLSPVPTSRNVPQFLRRRGR